MRRIAFSPLSLGIAVGLFLTPLAQAQEPGDEVPQVVAVVGLPYSGVGLQENVRVTQDGNRFIRKVTTRYYRDGRGRVRVEHDFPTTGSASGTAEALPRLVTINNKVTGELDSLIPKGRLASVIQRPGLKVVDAPATVPGIFTWFDGTRFGPKDPNWSAPTTLGEKSIEGVHVVGTQRVYTIAVGRIGNSKPVTITVQQWSSPDLGVIVDKTATASTGAQVRYQLTQIVQAEPDAALFRVPADYRTMVVNADTHGGSGADFRGSTSAATSAR